MSESGLEEGENGLRNSRMVLVLVSHFKLEKKVCFRATKIYSDPLKMIWQMVGIPSGFLTFIMYEIYVRSMDVQN